MQTEIVPILIYIASAVGLAVFLLVLGNLLNPRRPGQVKRMPYESGMDPLHDTRRRFDVRFHLMAIAFLVFDVELLFLYPWAVAIHRPSEPASRAVGPTLQDGRVPAPAGISRSGGNQVSDSASGTEVLTAPVANVPAHAAAAGASGLAGAAGRGGAWVGWGIRPAFVGGLIFVGLLVLGLVYDWKKGVFQWR